MRFGLILAVAMACGAGDGFVASARAALTPAQKRELLGYRSEISKAGTFIRKGDLDEGQKVLDEIEAKIDKMAMEGMAEKDLTVVGLKRSIKLQRDALARKRPDAKPAAGGMGGVSFTKDVAPILTQHCGRCHGATGNARGGLRVASVADIRKGGGKGASVAPGNPQGSLLLQRIVSGQMPPGNATKLNATEVATLSKWVAEGAKDDANDPAVQPKPGAMDNVVIPMATGKETVSFTRDIAPFMVNLCAGCHSGNDPSGGLELTSVRTLMKGGGSGRVIIPGNLEGSRLFRLVGGLENPRMPQGQARITRKNYDDLKQWFLEGNKFDVKDPDAPLRSIVPTDEELAAERFAKMTPVELVQHRSQATLMHWSRAYDNKLPRLYETEETLVMGNVPGERLKQVGDWAEEHAKGLRSLFNEPRAKDAKKFQPIFRGKLAILVIKDRFEFDEFNLIVESRDAPAEMIGFSKVTANQADAYVVLQDIGDDASASTPGLQISLVEHMTGARLQRDGGQLPDWLVRGLGISLAAKMSKDNPYIAGLRQTAKNAVARLAKPEDVFGNGQFAPNTVGAVGYTLVDFLLKAGGPPKLNQFIKQLQGGMKVDAALKQVYNGDPKNIAIQYMQNLGRSR